MLTKMSLYVLQTKLVMGLFSGKFVKEMKFMVQQAWRKINEFTDVHLNEQQIENILLNSKGKVCICCQNWGLILTSIVLM